MPRPLSEWPLRVARRWRRRLEPLVLGHRGLERLPLARPHAGGHLDAIELGEDGIAAVVGWAPDVDAFAGPLRLSCNGATLAPANVFRVPRPDLARLGGPHGERLGIVAEFVVPAEWANRTATLLVGDTAASSVPIATGVPYPYHQFHGNPGVWGRDHVYNVGAPVEHVSTEILALCDDLPGPVLDFGCGAGALLRALRSRGIEATGLELDTPVMRAAALPDAAPHVTYYDGLFPAPFADGAFASLTCCEVLEHIPSYAEAVAEMARLARRVLLTVPDMSAIPRGYPHGVVPWHLMERSHVNFFTQASLGDVLRPHFRDIRWYRIGEVRCDRLRFYTSLVAVCSR